MTLKRQLGSIGEATAKNWLVKHGYQISETNYKKPYGEVDIIAEKDGILHFVEVKTNKYYPESAFPPEIRVNARKARKLKKVCETYLRETRVSRDQKWQIDVISVIINENDSINAVNHIENAIFEEPY